MDIKILQTSLKYIFEKHKLKNEKKHSYLGVFTIKSFNNLNLTNIKNACLILFIDYINEKLGHFVSIFKINNKLIWVDSYGKSVSFYKKNITNKYISFTYYLSKKIQSNISTSCGAYCVFFIHMILKCDYDLNKYAKIILKEFPETKKFIENDKKIVSYIIRNTNISSKNCKKYFCNNSFIIKYNECLQSVCDVWQ